MTSEIKRDFDHLLQAEHEQVSRGWATAEEQAMARVDSSSRGFGPNSFHQIVTAYLGLIDEEATEVASDVKKLWERFATYPTGVDQLELAERFELMMEADLAHAVSLLRALQERNWLVDPHSHAVIAQGAQRREAKVREFRLMLTALRGKCLA